jgi:hypothetical protein
MGCSTLYSSANCDSKMEYIPVIIYAVLIIFLLTIFFLAYSKRKWPVCGECIFPCDSLVCTTVWNWYQQNEICR